MTECERCASLQQQVTDRDRFIEIDRSIIAQRDAKIERLRAALEAALPTLKRPSHDHSTCDCGPCKIMRQARAALGESQT